ncbi:curli polymerization inhibitor CsgI-related protein [Actinobacillus pleuropneumoniae]|uniref:curli polymerization inhibitor CsgI-related protein n=1 Tax=Actinobacillus pleuropneumoniae TaxID=715 RepID=UPI00384ABD70
MKLTKMAVTVATLAVSAFSVAGTLTASDSVELLAFDGQKVARGTAGLSIDGNVHQVVVSVSDIVDGSYFSIDPIILTFNGTDEDAKIVTPKFTSNFTVDKFKKELNFKIETASGKEIAYKRDFLKGEGFAPNSRVEDNLSKYNASKAVASVPAFANVALEAKGQMVIETNNVKEEQLQVLFKKADKETQKRFLEWAKKQQ